MGNNAHPCPVILTIQLVHALEDDSKRRAQLNTLGKPILQMGG